MPYLDQIRALENERNAIQKKLNPLNALMTDKQNQLAKLRADVATTEQALNAAVRHVGTIAGMQSLGAATALEAQGAQQTRRDAETAHKAAQAAFAGAHGLSLEIDGLGPVGYELGAQMMALATKDAALREGYLRELADEAAGEYAQAAKLLADKLASVLAFNQAMAAANFQPDLITPAAWHFAIPSLNSPSARTAHGGCLVEIDAVRLQQPKALAAIRARVAADGVAISGLV